MNPNSISDLKGIVRDIEENKIVLPDFQRQFVWKDESMQANLICSILAKMPIGSILLLESNADEYLCKVLGTKKTLDTTKIKNKVQFLLDGQQRLTVLTNVFSNAIFDHCDKITDLIHPSLKRRFFLRIPRWSNVDKEKDLFGIKNLIFPIKNPDSDEPDFLTSDIRPFIECIQFLSNDETPYNPKTNLSVALDNFCLNYNSKDVSGYLIPLFLLISTEKSNKKLIDLRYDEILDGIAENITKEILNYFTSLTSDEDKKHFLIDFLGNDEDKIRSILIDSKLFTDELNSTAKWWKNNLKTYLDECIKSVVLNKIVVSEKQRARAIDIYENLNRGGVSLSTFDLIMAKVAKRSHKNFYKRLIENIEEKKSYNFDIAPDIIQPILKNLNSYNASVWIESYDSKKDEIVSKYIDAFLDVLSLYSYNSELSEENVKIEYIKRDKILDLSPENIDNNCEKICTALDRAFFFLQARCGIRKLSELNYNLMLVVIATIFTNDKWFADKNVHNKLEAWYWASLFSGEYDKDQTPKAIEHMQKLIKMFKDKQTDCSWIENLNKLVFNGQNFSDKKLLLMEKVDEDRYPKNIIKNFVCQYFLAKTYPDMFDASLPINVFLDEKEPLEAHHIIPLGTAKKIRESSSKLRENPRHICNSPVNYVLITKSANLEISDDDLSVYAKKITNQAKSQLFIQSDYGSVDSSSDNYIKTVLSNRFDSIQGDVQQHISNLLK